MGSNWFDQGRFGGGKRERASCREPKHSDLGINFWLVLRATTRASSFSTGRRENRRRRRDTVEEEKKKKLLLPKLLNTLFWCANS
jgi:hypothetical protein